MKSGTSKKKTRSASELETAPVFYPTMEQMDKSFESYIESIEDQFAEWGICRIVPPEEWTPRAEGYQGLDNILLEKPIRQHAHGTRGVYRSTHIEQKSMRLSDFKQVACKPENQFPNRCINEFGDIDNAELERAFWKNVTLTPPLYGADGAGTLFDKDIKGWNLASLDTLLSRTFQDAGVVIPGVSTAYLYFGMWRSCFAWHTEDVDLYSVNYLHFGASKSWYSVPPAYRQRFESMLIGVAPDLYKECTQFLRHKEMLVSPQTMRSFNIPITRTVQHAREFVINYPGVYHAGFNQGFNCAESTNFATRRWVDIGAKAKICECHGDSVVIDMKLFGVADWVRRPLKRPAPKALPGGKRGCVAGGETQHAASSAADHVAHPPTSSKKRKTAVDEDENGSSGEPPAVKKAKAATGGRKKTAVSSHAAPWDKVSFKKKRTRNTHRGRDAVEEDGEEVKKPLAEIMAAAAAAKPLKNRRGRMLVATTATGKRTFVMPKPEPVDVEGEEEGHKGREEAKGWKRVSKLLLPGAGAGVPPTASGTGVCRGEESVGVSGEVELIEERRPRGRPRKMRTGCSTEVTQGRKGTKRAVGGPHVGGGGELRSVALKKGRRRATHKPLPTEGADVGAEAEGDERWAECDMCGKWRRLPSEGEGCGMELESDDDFMCRMLPGLSCQVPEEDYEEDEGMVWMYSGEPSPLGGATASPDVATRVTSTRRVGQQRPQPTAAAGAIAMEGEEALSDGGLESRRLSGIGGGASSSSECKEVSEQQASDRRPVRVRRARVWPDYLDDFEAMLPKKRGHRSGKTGAVLKLHVGGSGGDDTVDDDRVSDENARSLGGLAPMVGQCGKGAEGQKPLVRVRSGGGAVDNVCVADKGEEFLREGAKKGERDVAGKGLASASDESLPGMPVTPLLVKLRWRKEGDGEREGGGKWQVAGGAEGNDNRGLCMDSVLSVHGELGSAEDGPGPSSFDAQCEGSVGEEGLLGKEGGEAFVSAGGAERLVVKMRRGRDGRVDVVEGTSGCVGEERSGVSGGSCARQGLVKAERALFSFSGEETDVIMESDEEGSDKLGRRKTLSDSDMGVNWTWQTISGTRKEVETAESGPIARSQIRCDVHTGAVATATLHGLLEV